MELWIPHYYISSQYNRLHKAEITLIKDKKILAREKYITWTRYWKINNIAFYSHVEPYSILFHFYLENIQINPQYLLQNTFINNVYVRGIL